MRRTTAVPAPAPERFNIVLGIAVTIALTALLCAHLLPNRTNLKLGETATSDVVAQRTVRYEDTELTSRLRREAADDIDEVFVVQSDAAKQADEALQAVFSIVETADRDAEKVIVADVERATGLALSYKKVLEPLLSADRDGRTAALNVASAVLSRVMITPIHDTQDDIAVAKRDAAAAMAIDTLPEQLRSPVRMILQGLITPNRILDRMETTRRRADAQSRIPRQYRRVAAGQAVIRSGERTTQAHLDAFSALGLRSATLDASAISTVFLLVSGMVLLVSAFARQYAREIWSRNNLKVLTAIVVTIAVAGIKIGSTLLGLPFSGVHFGYLGMMCVASAGMVLAVLVCPNISILVVALLSTAAGLILNNELRFTIVTLGSSLVGIVAVSTLRNRTDLLRSGLLLAISNAFLIVLAGLIEGDTLQEHITGVLWGVVAGGVALMLFYLGVAIFERIFGVTTHLRLLELADPATPLLQEFRMHVPGTYAHSLMVANLASGAAEAIGADALLTRVAAYYHDLGKMSRPEFFIENQTGENIHETINPSLSAVVLASHVKDGMEMAKVAGIPAKVIDVMSQHHGTSVMKYFYHQATDGVPDRLLEAQFRYPGPKPQSKEAAILMLADTVEAASRVLQQATPQKLAEFVQRMIQDKLADGQLDESDLTLREMKTIETVFIHILSGTMHGRIRYPEQDQADAALEAPRELRSDDDR